MNKLASILMWGVLAAVGAFAFAALALGRGESVNAVWLVTAALIVYFIAYRFYSKFIAERVLRDLLLRGGDDVEVDEGHADRA